MTTEGANEDEKCSKEDEDGDEDLDSEDKISDKNSEEEDLTSSNPNPNQKLLPEHLFASTFFPTPEQNKISALRKKRVHKKDTKKHRPHRTKPKTLY